MFGPGLPMNLYVQREFRNRTVGAVGMSGALYVLSRTPSTVIRIRPDMPYRNAVETPTAFPKISKSVQYLVRSRLFSGSFSGLY